MIRTWWPQGLRAKTPCPRRAHPVRRPGHHRRRLVVETLECRALPSFLPAVNYPVGPPSVPFKVAVGDLRGNGVLDVVTDNYNTQTVSVLLGNGDGTFQAPVEYPLGGNPSPFLALGDVTGNGILDIVVAGPTTTVLLGNGDGTFQPPISTNFGSPLGQLADFQLADLTGAGKLDLVAVNSFGSQPVLSVALGNGDGTFRQPYAYSAAVSTPNSLVVGDFNGDGIPDIAMANSYTVCDSEGGDCSTTGAVTLFLGSGGGQFSAARVIHVVPGAGSIVAGDFNGDGILDLLTINTTIDHRDSISVLFGNGDGTFQQPVTTPRPQGPLGPAVVADFNGDGILDVAALNQSANAVGVFLSNGDGTFQEPLNFAVDAAPRALAVGDFNGDGFPDLVTANFVPSRDVSVLLNDTIWETGPGGARGPRQGSPAELDVVPAPRVAEPAPAAELPWTPPTRPTPVTPSTAVALADMIHASRREMQTQPLDLLDAEPLSLLSW